MASLTKQYSEEKLFGKIYTPKFIVDKILDSMDFNTNAILGKSILDPACGDGRFLEEVVRRIVKFSTKKKDLVQNLEKVHGWDIDEDAIILCKKNLDEIISEENIIVNWNIKKINWQIQTEDSLKKIEQTLFEENKLSFDFIVGNPPYIRIQHLEEKQRRYIQKNYFFCQNGSTDIYIAFFELCYQLLAEDGICGLITPNTFFYTETAKEMRDFFVSKLKKITRLKKISNYGTIQVFENATTYSAITIFDKKEHTSFEYEQAEDKKTFSAIRKIEVQELADKNIWQLSTKPIQKIKGKKLGEISSIHVGITTLADKVYIFNNPVADEDFYKVKSRALGKTIKIETNILKPVFKASTLKQNKISIKDYILFPYQKDESGKHKIIPEEILKNDFPLAYQYLLSVKEDFLDKRDNGKPNSVAWYAFGRSQGLDTSFGKKILFSPMNKKPNFILSEEENATFYSGYCIKYKGNYEKLLEQLNSKRMEEYIAVSSRDFRGGWKAYNKKVLQDFIIETG